VGWNYLSFGLGKLLVFISTAILARLLTQEDFGIVGFATVAVSYLSILKDMGLGAALIQRREDVGEASNTVFTLNLIVGLALTVLAMLIAPIVANFFREPLVVPILRWLGLTFILNALGSVHTIRLQRELDFRRKLVPDLGRAVTKGVVSIAFAVAGSGVWALVYGQLAGVAASVVLAWIVFPWRPKLSVDREMAGSLLKFGVAVIGIDALAIINDNVDYLLVGRIFGNAAMGIYTLAYRLPELLVINVLWVMGAVVFPAYSAVQTNRDELRQIFLTTVRIVEIIVVPLCLGLLIAADPLVRVAFGNQWLEAIPILRVLAAYALVLSIGFHVGGVYKAIGRPDISVKLSLLTLVILVPALWIGSTYGLIGIAFGHLVAVLIRGILRLVVATRFVDISLRDILLQLGPAFRGGIALTALALPVLFMTDGLDPLVRLLALTVAGAFGYLGVMLVFERDSLIRLGKMIGILKDEERERFAES
jgi:O-antigen/teichoic acid export membrane protein